MQVTVRREERPGIDGSPAVEVGRQAAGLLDDDRGAAASHDFSPTSTIASAAPSATSA